MTPPMTPETRQALTDGIAAELRCLADAGDVYYDADAAARALVDKHLPVVRAVVPVGCEEAEDDASRLRAEVARHRENAAVIHADLAAILRALSLGDHARVVSPHWVVQQEVLPAIGRLTSDLAAARDEVGRLTSVCQEGCDPVDGVCRATAPAVQVDPADPWGPGVPAGDPVGDLAGTWEAPGSEDVHTVAADGECVDDCPGCWEDCPACEGTGDDPSSARYETREECSRCEGDGKVSLTASPDAVTEGVAGDGR